MVYNQCILPVLTYELETWSLTKTPERKLQSVKRGMERIMLGITLKDRMRALIMWFALSNWSPVKLDNQSYFTAIFTETKLLPENQQNSASASHIFGLGGTRTVAQ